MAFNSSAAFTAATAHRNGAKYVSMEQNFTPVPQKDLSQWGKIGAVISKGVRSNGTDILYVQFMALDPFGGNASIKLDAPMAESINLRVGDMVNTDKQLGMKPIQAGPTVAPINVIAFSEKLTEADKTTYTTAFQSEYKKLTEEMEKEEDPYKKIQLKNSIQQKAIKVAEAALKLTEAEVTEA